MVNDGIISLVTGTFSEMNVRYFICRRKCFTRWLCLKIWGDTRTRRRSANVTNVYASSNKASLTRYVIWISVYSCLLMKHWTPRLSPNFTSAVLATVKMTFKCWFHPFMGVLCMVLGKCNITTYRDSTDSHIDISFTVLVDLCHLCGCSCWWHWCMEELRMWLQPVCDAQEQDRWSLSET